MTTRPTTKRPARQVHYGDRVVWTDGRLRKPVYLYESFDFNGDCKYVYVVTVVKGERVGVTYGPTELVEVEA